MAVGVRSRQGIEPTNNASERALRYAVIWRTLAFGTQSADGSRFVETIHTVIETRRQPNKSAFEFVAQTVEASSAPKKPSLFTGV